MITFLLIVGLLISIITNIFTIRIIKIQIDKVKIYEKWILEFQQDVESTLAKMRKIDNIGSFATNLNANGVFEHDDQVGIIFKDLEKILEELNEIIK